MYKVQTRIPTNNDQLRDGLTVTPGSIRQGAEAEVDKLISVGEAEKSWGGEGFAQPSNTTAYMCLGPQTVARSPHALSPHRVSEG